MDKSVDVEIILTEYNNTTKKSIVAVVENYLKNKIFRPNSVINFERENTNILHGVVKTVIIGEIAGYDKSFVDFNNLNINWFVYKLDAEGPLLQNEEDGEEEVTISTQLMLPSESLFNLWENLYYDHSIKQNLLKYAQTMMEFSDKGVDQNIISCNRVILLHGPPGTGKTSLCKALAQKLTIRMGKRFGSGVLIEINSHSLFSKWFSESGKLVNKMFSKINDFIENKDILVCVLMDEVESLAHARNQCVSGTEPSDSIRVVNALLTQIDKIKQHSNVLIFATSNMTEAIDLAFIDRADIKQHLGNPSKYAIYKVYYSCINELIKSKIVTGDTLESTDYLISNEDKQYSPELKKLLDLCETSVGLSGRSLRKIPFLAHALFLEGDQIQLGDFLEAMERAVHKEILERKYFEQIKLT
ncbi:pachytene checkpoint protein 2 homolog isoform X2 [Diabrotica virgifera virgifera]|uniref:Pachytene checkpoint protein 2 homolog isoform X2 n=1 Tax=Diabrotica virgifera virgifera TaxID=50390 RepID=A0A6P7F6K7_DIAVI|nr:pachytene checkpoint protein 2 homolog isoform X2 [Diabrotica virgifera virgifera]